MKSARSKDYRRISLVDDSTRSFMENITGGNPHLLKDGKVIKDNVSIKEHKKFKDVTYDFLVYADAGKNIHHFFSISKDPMRYTIKKYRGKNLIKFKLNINFKFEKLSGGEYYEEIDIWNNTTFQDLLSDNQFDNAYQLMKESVTAWLDDFQERGSGLNLIDINYGKLTISHTNPLRGKSYIPCLFPKKYSILNIQNDDYRCFLYCIIASYYPVKRNRTRVSNYTKYTNQFYTDYQYPMKISDIPKFETYFKVRYNFAINVFGLEDPYHLDTLYPIQLSDNKYPDHIIDLLFLQDGDNTHYCLIDDLASLLGMTEHKNYICRNCLQSFSTENSIENHKRICGKHEKCV